MAPSTIEVAAQVVKIEPGGKYVLVFAHYISNADLARLQHDLQEFMANDKTFAIIAGDSVSIVRVDDEDRAASE